MKVNMSWGVIGLMFSKKCDIPIIIPGTSWIHTLFMKYSIDILYLDKEMIIVDKYEGLKPWGHYKSHAAGIEHVIEAMSGKFKNFKVGDKVEIEII